MAGRMTLKPSDIRQTIAIAVTDDLAHNQPEFMTRPAATEKSRRRYEVAGFVDLDRLGAFAADQLVKVIERKHPGLIAYLNEQHTEVTEADVLATLEATGLPGDPYHAEQAAAVAKLVAERTTFKPDFFDL